MGVTQSAGLSLNWLRKTFFPGHNYDELTAAAEKVPAGSEGLEWAPYLLGERTPHLDPEVRAAFAGISTVHTAAHFVRAVLEGVAYSLEDTFTLFAELGIPVSGIRLGGGGARAAVEEDSGGDLRARRRGADGRRGRSVWLGADGRSGRGALGQSGRSLRSGDRGCATHRAGCGGFEGLPGWICAVAEAVPGTKEFAVEKCGSAR